MGKKPFLDKKNVRVFRLVNRSVLGDEENEKVDEIGNPLPDRVFIEVTPNQDAEDFGAEEESYEQYSEEYEEDTEGEDVDVGEEVDNHRKLTAERAGEAAKYGVFFDDRQYDYTQHLKPIGKAPGAVFVAATASTTQHSDSGLGDLVPDQAETLLNHATYDKIKETDADPTVLETLDALEDDAFIDEDAFEDDFIVKLDREETSILAPLDQIKGHRLDGDFQKILRIYEDDDEGKHYDDEEEYGSLVDGEEEGEGEEIDVCGESEMHPWQQLEELRADLAQGDPKLLERILYTDDEDVGKDDLEVIEVEVEDLDHRQLNCQTANEWRPTRSTFKPAIISSAPSNRKDTTETKIEPIRISRKTGMPLGSMITEAPLPKARKEAAEDDAPHANKGAPRPKEETSEEKRARKAAIKQERKEKRTTKKALRMTAIPAS